MRAVLISALCAASMSAVVGAFAPVADACSPSQVRLQPQFPIHDQTDVALDAPFVFRQPTRRTILHSKEPVTIELTTGTRRET